VVRDTTDNSWSHVLSRTWTADHAWDWSLQFTNEITVGWAAEAQTSRPYPDGQLESTSPAPALKFCSFLISLLDLLRRSVRKRQRCRMRQAQVRLNLTHQALNRTVNNIN
jgi:hypothetical protein